MENFSDSSDLKRQLGLFSTTIVVIANMIGTGIFTTSGFIIKELENPLTMLFSWFIGGIFALCGALCYGELGAMFPEAGGEYIFLREAFGKLIGFLCGWISLIVGFSAPIAAAAIAFATYFLKALPVSFYPDFKLILSFFNIPILTISPITIIASVIIFILSLVHYRGLVLGACVQNSLTLFKISFIIFFIITGLLFGNGSFSHFLDHFNLNSIFQSKFAISLIFVSFAYSGWNAAAYLGSEIKHPKKNIPLALFIGTLLVTCLYILLNIVYIYALPPKEMCGVLEVGTKTAIALFDKQISKYFSLAIALGLLSVLSAMIMTGPRVYYAMARDGIFFKFFAKVNKKYNTPAYSIFLQATIAIIMVVTTSFDVLLLYIGFTLAIFSMLSVIGIFRLRGKYTSLANHYKTPGYPITPFLFILGNLWIIYFSIKDKPIASLCGLTTIAIGIILYFYFKK